MVKRIKRILLILLLVMPFITVDASCIKSDGTGKKGSVSLSASSLTVYVDKKATFKINAPCSAGKVSIKSSDTNIATVSPKGSQFLDDSSITVTVKGKSEGKVTISVSLDDIADYASNVFSGTKKVTVNVKKQPVVKKTTDTKKTETKTTTEVKEMKITKFDVIGYDINFNPDILEYTIDVAQNVSKLYINVKGENFSATGDKEVNIEGKNSIVVSLKNGDNTINYTININRQSNEQIIAPEIKEVTKEVVKMNNTYLYISIGLLVVCIILVINLLKKKSNNTNTITKEKSINPLQTTLINPVPSDTNTTNNSFTNTQTSTIEIFDLSSKNNIVNPTDNNLQ